MKALESILCFATLSALTALAPACAAPNDEPVGASEGATKISDTGVAITHATTSFTGTFTVRDAHYVKHEFTYRVSNIDWKKGTAHWQHIENGEASRDLEMTISTARCPGCYTFVAQSSGRTIVTLGIGEWRLASIGYFGTTADKATLTSPSDAPLPSGDPKEKGACARVCDGEVVGCFEKTREACNWGAFDPFPICLHSFDFKPGGTCR